MITPHRHHLRIALVGAAAAALLLSGCSAGASAHPGNDASAHSWSYTDALGHTVTLPERPTRIAGLNDVAVSLLEYGITPVATFGYSSIQQDDRYKGLDTSGITQVGTSYGQINLEKLAEAKPQLIVTDVYPTDAKGTIDRSQPDYGFKDMQQQKEVAQIAPIVTIYMGGDGAAVVSHTTDLAAKLGAKSSVISAAKKKFETARAKLHTAAEKSKVTVTALYADSDGVSVAKPNDDPGLRMYRNAGVKMTVPSPKGYYWGNYSWENAAKIGGDMILLEQSGYTEAQLKKQPTFADNTALKAGQVHPWASSGMDYIQQAAYMTELASWLTESKPLS